MFASDKDLRKAPAKKSGSKVSTSRASKTQSSSGADVVERAKREREERQVERNLAKMSIVIQSWWRGRWNAWKLISYHRNDFDRKIADLERIANLLKTTKNITLVPPLSTCMDLCKKVLIGRYTAQVCFGFNCCAE